MYITRLLCLTCFALFHSFTNAQAQIPTEYEVAVWSQFKTAAVTYTMDDNTSNQLPIAIPIFDKYDFKSTLFTITSLSPNWAKLKIALDNGHEVASHTVTHPDLSSLSLADQETELKQSQETIIANVAGARAQTVAYPFCNAGDIPTIQKYYMAARICSNVIEPSSPKDFYGLSSIATGTEASVKTTADFNAKVELAKTSGGWCVFLIHGIDNDGGYSSTASLEIDNHLKYVKASDNYWVGTFEQVVKYIKERNAIALTEVSITADSLQVVADDKLDDTQFDVPVTIKRIVPTGWEGVKVYADNKLIASAIKTINGKKYVIFDVVPDKKVISLANAHTVVTGFEDHPKGDFINVSPNPFLEKITIAVNGNFIYNLSSVEGKILQNGIAFNEVLLGNEISQGLYLLRVFRNNQIFNFKIIKK